MSRADCTDDLSTHQAYLQAHRLANERRITVTLMYNAGDWFVAAGPETIDARKARGYQVVAFVSPQGDNGLSR